MESQFSERSMGFNGVHSSVVYSEEPTVFLFNQAGLKNKQDCIEFSIEAHSKTEHNAPFHAIYLQTTGFP